MRLEKLAIDRNEFIARLKAAGVGCSVHWRPLHLHPYYRDRFGWTSEQFPVASPLWERLVSLPLFPGMQASGTGSRGSSRPRLVRAEPRVNAKRRTSGRRATVPQPSCRRERARTILRLPGRGARATGVAGRYRRWPWPAAGASSRGWIGQALVGAGRLAGDCNRVCVLLPAGRRFYARRFPQLVLAGASLLLAWAVAEVALGPVLAQLAEPLHGRRPGLEFVYRPAAGIMRDVGSEAHVKFNSWGVRGDEPPARGAAYRILCLGGSSTACTYLDDSKTWPERLEQELNRNRTESRVLGRQRRAAGLSQRWASSIPGRIAAGRPDRLRRRAGRHQRLHGLPGRSSARAPLVDAISRSGKWPALLGQARCRCRHGGRGHGRFGLRAATGDSRRPPQSIRSRPSWPPAWMHSRTNLERIVDICRRKNVRLIFTTQPVLWRGDLDDENQALLWFGQLRDGRFLSVEQLRQGMDRYNDALRAVCDERQVELIDLAPLDGDASVFYDDCHFTETGARRVAALVAQWFAAHPLPPEQGQPFMTAILDCTASAPFIYK